MGFTLITTIPDVCNVKCLCYKCGLQNMPNLASDWWCDNVCCCLFNQFGLKELLDCQIFFLGPCKLTAPALNLTTSIPVRKIELRTHVWWLSINFLWFWTRIAWLLTFCWLNMAAKCQWTVSKKTCAPISVFAFTPNSALRTCSTFSSFSVWSVKRELKLDLIRYNHTTQSDRCQYLCWLSSFFSFRIDETVRYFIIFLALLYDC